jgi:hypothetical protein
MAFQMSFTPLFAAHWSSFLGSFDGSYSINSLIAALRQPQNHAFGPEAPPSSLQQCLIITLMLEKLLEA